MDEILIKQRQNQKNSLIVTVGLLVFLLAVVCMSAGFYAGRKTNKSNSVVPPIVAEVVRPKTELPDGPIFNDILTNANGENADLDFVGENITSITFDYYTTAVEFDDDNNIIDEENLKKEYVVDGINLIDGVEPYVLAKDIDLYAFKDGEFVSLYILSFKTISTTANANNMFYNFNKLEELNFNNFNTENATTMYAMFEHTETLHFLDVSCFNTSNVTDMSSMFYCCGVWSLNLASFNTAKVNDFLWFLGDSPLYEINLSSFDTRNCEDMHLFFWYNKNLKTIYASDNFVVKNYESDMFRNMTKLVGGNGTFVKNKEYGSEYARVDREGQPGYFTDVSQFVNIKNKLPLGEMLRDAFLGIDAKDDTPVNSITFDYYNENNTYLVDGVDIVASSSRERVADTTYLYRHKNQDDKYDIYVLSNEQIYANRDASCMFEPYDHDVYSDLHTEILKDKISPLYRVSSIVFRNFNTSITTDMNKMFYCQYELTDLDLSCFDTSQVTDMSNMFMCCSSLENVNLTSFNTGKVKTFLQFFGRCKFTSVDVSSFDTSSAETIYNMFWECDRLIKVDLSNFNTSKVKVMGGLFFWCYNLQEVDLSGFSLESVTAMGSMFSKCYNLQTVYVSNKWSTSHLDKEYSIFEECYSLKGGAGTKFSSAHITTEYACVDGGETNPGYFTLKTK